MNIIESKILSSTCCLRWFSDPKQENIQAQAMSCSVLWFSCLLLNSWWFFFFYRCMHLLERETVRDKVINHSPGGDGHTTILFLSFSSWDFGQAIRQWVWTWVQDSNCACKIQPPFNSVLRVGPHAQINCHHCCIKRWDLEKVIRSWINTVIVGVGS